MFSILFYSASAHFYKIYAICATPNTTCPLLLGSVQSRYIQNSELVFLCYPIELPVNAVQQARFSKAAFGRFFLPVLVAESPVVYLDADTLANRDIFPFSELPFNSSLYFYAALCYNIASSTVQKMLMQLKFDRMFYYNSGVLLFNTKTLRLLNFTQITVQTFISNVNGYPFVDQDVLNSLYGRSHVRLFPNFRYQCQPDRRTLNS
jgi:lipopolysaccharide biosynthesis glycosyltransferase